MAVAPQRLKRNSSYKLSAEMTQLVLEDKLREKFMTVCDSLECQWNTEEDCIAFFANLFEISNEGKEIISHYGYETYILFWTRTIKSLSLVLVKQHDFN